jgi:hypothetical protein
LKSNWLQSKSYHSNKKAIRIISGPPFYLNQ